MSADHLPSVTRTKPYRPSNGTEGCIFYDTYCCRCHREQGDEGCSIFLDAMAFDIDDPDYPSEWVDEWHQGRCLGARCTAFADAHYPEATPRCPFTLDMFGALS